MKTKLLTLDDLYAFYSTKKKSMSFSSEKSGYNISVQVNGSFAIEEDENSEGLLYGKIKAFHDLGNRNKSYIDPENFKKYVPSMKDRPIMADIIDIEEEDGTVIKDFNGHTMRFDEELDKFIYIESPVGHFVNPDKFELVYDEEYDRTFVIADVVIYEEYTDACDIIRRRQEVDVSVELCIRDLSYDCKTSELHINNFYVQGCTLLGNHVQPGMAGSKLSLKDFSEENNSVFSNLSDIDALKEQMIEMQESINSLLSRFNIEANAAENTEEGGTETVTKFEELLQKYNKTVEDITFETEGLSDEELETKFAEVFGEESNTDPASEEGATVVEVEETEEQVAVTEVEETEETVVENTEESSNDTIVVENSEDVNDEDNVVEDVMFNIVEKTCDFEGRKFSISFELSHDDIRWGLYNLLSQYDELDNEWYSIRAVYDDYFVFQGWCTNKIYGQSYTKDGDTVAFEGERYNLHEELLTDSELAQLNEMRSNYSSIRTELNSYKEAEMFADKMTVFEDENYTQFLETSEFKELMKEENVKKYSKQELEDKANIVFSKLVKKNKTFALETTEKPEKQSMFAFGKMEQKSSFLDGLLKQK